MGFNAAMLDVMADAAAAAATHATLHSAAPDNDTGTNVTSDVRVPIAWDSVGGNLSLTGTEAFTGPANGPVTHVGVWSALTAGTFYGAFALAGDQAFNAAGEYDLNEITVNGSATG